MRRYLIILSVLVLATSSHARQTSREISFSRMKEAGLLSGGEILASGGPDSGRCLKLVSDSEEGRTIETLVIEPVGIGQPSYAITGKVRCDGVQGKGHLEMRSHFPGGGFFFSRTLAEFGPLRHLEGSSDWRAFTLPFFCGDMKTRPEKLVLNVVFPGRGTVYLSQLRLVEYTSEDEALRGPGSWWSGRTGGVIGGIMGATVGLLGGLVGLLSSMGKARGFVVGLLVAMITVGVLSLAAGLLALWRAQPYAVYYPLLLIGLLATVIPSGLLPVIRKRYEALELRKMNALDAR